MFERASPGDDLAAGIGFAFSLFGAGFERLQLCGADATPRNVALFVAPETANDLGQLARQMAIVDDTRSASQFHVSNDPRPAAQADVAERRARVNDAAERHRRQGEATAGGSGRGTEREMQELREACEAAAEASAREERERSRERERDRGGRSR